MWELGQCQRSFLWSEAKRVAVTKGWISSTEASALLYLNPEYSQVKLWQLITGRKKHRPKYGPGIDWGNKYEEEAIESAKSRIVLPEGCEWTRPGTVYDPWSTFCCSPDQFGGKTGLEVKCRYSKKVPEEPQECEWHHIIQCFVCIHVMGTESWHLYYYDPKKPETSTLWIIYKDQDVWDTMKKSAAILKLRGPKRKTWVEQERINWIKKRLLPTKLN